MGLKLDARDILQGHPDGSNRTNVGLKLRENSSSRSLARWLKSDQCGIETARDAHDALANARLKSDQCGIETGSGA